MPIVGDMEATIIPAIAKTRRKILYTTHQWVIIGFRDRKCACESPARSPGRWSTSSWIRRMFEIGVQLRRERGAENVFDFSIGNPDVEPPDAVIAALHRVVAENRPRTHSYMPNAGYPEVRATIARRLAERTGIPFTADDILMTNGAAGAINTVLKAILDPGDEVMVLSPVLPRIPFLHREPRRPRRDRGDRPAFPARPRAYRAPPSRRAPAPSSSIHPTIRPASSTVRACCAPSTASSRTPYS